jgi:hypothetical protein
MSLSQWTAHPDYQAFKAAVMAKVEEGKHSPALRKIKRVETMAEIEQEEAEKAKASKEKKRKREEEKARIEKIRKEDAEAIEILTKYEEQQKSLMEVRRREEQREIEEANERAREWEGIPGPDGNTLLLPITDEGDFEESQIEFEFVLYESA